MSEEQFGQDQDQELPQITERESLEARANIMGIQFHTNISTEKLRERINSALVGSQESTTTGETKPVGKETDVERKSRKRKEAAKLIRCRIHCNDPAKKEWPGEYITVGNNAVGTFRKYIPYNLDEPYHIPQIIFNALREKRVQVFTTKRGKDGNPVREAKSISAYNIEVLEPLTEEALKRLSASQLARNALSDN